MLFLHVRPATLLLGGGSPCWWWRSRSWWRSRRLARRRRRALLAGERRPGASAAGAPAPRVAGWVRPRRSPARRVARRRPRCSPGSARLPRLAFGAGAPGAGRRPRRAGGPLGRGRSWRAAAPSPCAARPARRWRRATAPPIPAAASSPPPWSPAPASSWPWWRPTAARPTASLVARAPARRLRPGRRGGVPLRRRPRPRRRARGPAGAGPRRATPRRRSPASRWSPSACCPARTRAASTSISPGGRGCSACRRRWRRGGFAFQALVEGGRRIPGGCSTRTSATGVVPAFADANSASWILQLGLGDELLIADEAGRPLRLRLVGPARAEPVPERAADLRARLLRHFPSRAGAPFFLVDAPRGGEASRARWRRRSRRRSAATASTPRRRPSGCAPTAAVEDTYLATFQTLGGLGLLLGTVGLGVVLLRNALERRRELAMLRRLGFRRGAARLAGDGGELRAARRGRRPRRCSRPRGAAPRLAAQAAAHPLALARATLLAVLAVGCLASLAAVRTVPRAAPAGAQGGVGAPRDAPAWQSHRCGPCQRATVDIRRAARRSPPAGRRLHAAVDGAPTATTSARVAMLHAALDAGVTLLDTADAYCRDDGEVGHNERLIARALATLERRPLADPVATKGGLTRPGGRWVPDGRARHLAAACEASRRALGRRAHRPLPAPRPDPRTPLATSVRALAALQRDGRVRADRPLQRHVGQLEEARRDRRRSPPCRWS